MTAALAFDFTYDDLPGPETVAARARLAAVPALPREDGVAPAPTPRRRLYAVRGSVDAPAPSAPPALAPSVEAPSLDVILGGAWSALSAVGHATCPVCDEATLVARYSAGHGVAGGRCASCGSSLQ